MKGKIIKGIGGFYYVWCEDNGVYECQARGIFRKEGIKPLPGDNVEIQVLDGENFLGSIEEILPRTRELIRPAVANVDQAVVIFAMKNPKPHLNLLDRFLLMMERQGIDTVVCFSKRDLVSGEEEKALTDIYGTCAGKVIPFSNKDLSGLDQIRQCLRGKTSVLAGPSGVGKSSLLNRIFPEAKSETGDVSRKIGRGRHTTRHTELFYIGNRTFLVDTPGFSSLQVPDMPKEELCRHMREFIPWEGMCRYQPCSHIHEPGCKIKEKLEAGELCQSRYDSYVQMYGELAENERRKRGRSKR